MELLTWKAVTYQSTHGWAESTQNYQDCELHESGKRKSQDDVKEKKPDHYEARTRTPINPHYSRIPLKLVNLGQLDGGRGVR